MPSWWWASATAKATSALVAGRHGVVLADADDRAVDSATRVTCRSTSLTVARCSSSSGMRPQAEEAKVPWIGVEPVVERPQPVDVVGLGGTDANRPSRRQQHVPLERR